MWPFQAKPSVSALSDEVERLDRRLKSLELEWDDFYDKAAKILRRIGRDRAKLDGAEEQATPATPSTTLQPSDGTGVAGRLSPRQFEIQQQILKRRAGLR